MLQEVFISHHERIHFKQACSDQNDHSNVSLWNILQWSFCSVLFPWRVVEALNSLAQPGAQARQIIHHQATYISSLSFTLWGKSTGCLVGGKHSKMALSQPQKPRHLFAEVGLTLAQLAFRETFFCALSSWWTSLNLSQNKASLTLLS